jgi:hypothetical protein
MSIFLNRLAGAEKIHRAIVYDWCFPDAKIENDPSFGPFVAFGGGVHRAYVANDLGTLYQLYIKMYKPESRHFDWFALSKPETFAGMCCFIYSMNTDSENKHTCPVEIVSGDIEYFEKWQVKQ